MLPTQQWLALWMLPMMYPSKIWCLCGHSTYWVGGSYRSNPTSAGTSVTIIDQPVPASTFGCSGDDIWLHWWWSCHSCWRWVQPSTNHQWFLYPQQPTVCFRRWEHIGNLDINCYWYLRCCRDDGTLSEWGIVYTHSVAAPYVVDLDANGMANN